MWRPIAPIISGVYCPSSAPWEIPNCGCFQLEFWRFPNPNSPNRRRVIFYLSTFDSGPNSPINNCPREQKHIVACTEQVHYSFERQAAAPQVDKSPYPCFPFFLMARLHMGYYRTLDGFPTKAQDRSFFFCRGYNNRIEYSWSESNGVERNFGKNCLSHAVNSCFPACFGTGHMPEDHNIAQ